MKNITLFLSLIVLSHSAFALNFEPLRVSIWKKGETYYGHDLIAANEAVADYFASLQRPSDPHKAIKYDCQVKFLDRELRVNLNTTTASSGLANILTVYDAKDCKASND